MPSKIRSEARCKKWSLDFGPALIKTPAIISYIDPRSESDGPIDFQRREPRLLSGPSLLTRVLNEPQRATPLAASTSGSGRALRRSRTSPSIGREKIPTSAVCPRRTRRKMLQSELTGSLRDAMLLERKDKTKTANAWLTRRHTSEV